MSGITKINIQESSTELEQIMGKQTIALYKDRIQVLYWLKTGKVSQIQAIADLMCKNRTTIHRWLKQYQEEGLSSLIEVKGKSGRKSHIPESVREEIALLVKQHNKFDNYQDILNWLKDEHQIKVAYHVVQELICYRLEKASNL